jgi:translation initiation factor IF-2
VTDIVVIVVAADDSIMPQTIEAINHAKAAEVPIIVAVNKIDLPAADPQKVKTELLQHEVVVEDMSGDVQCIEVSALKKTNLDKLEEAIILQAELLELKANPNREAHGVVVESKLEKGRGPVSTVLIQKGTLRVGDVFVAGAEFGKVRALINDQGKTVDEAIPGQPVEVLGLDGAPEAGDVLNVVADEGKAKEVAEYRQRKRRESQAAIAVKGRTTIDDLIAARETGEKTALPVIVKGDVHGSVEAIIGSFQKMVEENEDIEVQALHTGVGGITESDVKLARAAGGVLIGFNVRANAQARDLAQREGVDIRYYNVIYDVIDDAKAILTGMLSPTQREEYLGQAEIKEVFNITGVGKVAGCMVTLGMVKRGSGVRLLRDDVVIHEGTLKTLQRFKDEVKEVKEGTECGMAFENYDDIKAGDVIECYDVVEEARKVS